MTLIFKEKKGIPAPRANGFTLIELLVAVFIFSLVMTMAAGIFVSGLRAQKRSLQSSQLLNQVSYVTEYMSRSLRMARKDDFGGKNCLSGSKVNYELTRAGRGIKFRNYKDQCQEFYLEDDRLKEEKDGDSSALTSDDLEVTSFRVNAYGWPQPPADNLQPRVTLFLEVTAAGQGPARPKLEIQTTLSQRNLDIPK